MANVIYGDGCIVGEYAVAESDVIIGDDVKLGHLVVLRTGARIGNKAIIKDGVKTEGLCIIGENVVIGQNSVICEGSIINDDAIVGPSSVIGYSIAGKNKKTIVDHGQRIPAGARIESGRAGSPNQLSRDFSRLDMARYFQVEEG